MKARLWIWMSRVRIPSLAPTNQYLREIAASTLGPSNQLTTNRQVIATNPPPADWIGRRCGEEVIAMAKGVVAGREEARQLQAGPMWASPRDYRRAVS